jgi:hypothetical protein
MIGRASELPLWQTLPGASRSLAGVWAAWLAVVLVLSAPVTWLFGPAGTVLVVLGTGWWLARSQPEPVECLRRYHLDDAEVVVMGPGRYVRRLAWTAVEAVVQERRTFTLYGPGTRVRLPLLRLVAAEAWGAALVRVVPSLAAELWTRVEDGSVKLAPSSAPPLSGLAWWAWVPALVACAVSAGTDGLLAGVVLAALERGVAWMRTQARAVTLSRAGVESTLGRRTVVVPWADALVQPTHEGLVVSGDGGPTILVSTQVPNFWAIAPVVELRAQLGGECPAEVHFRVRVDGGGLEVVGEIDALV